MIIEKVIRILSDGGIRADTAFPPERITRILEPVAAVSVDKVDLAERNATILVEIFGPKDSGGDVCQRKALQACEILEAAGAECVLEGCSFHNKGNMFRVPVRAKFRGALRAHSMEEMPKYTVTTGPFTLRYVCGFSAEQERVSPETVLQTAPWVFTVEEFIPWGVEDTLVAEEPFEMFVTCMGVVERFEQCKWIHRKRIAEDLGVRQIRKGTAIGRSLTLE